MDKDIALIIPDSWNISYYIFSYLVNFFLLLTNYWCFFIQMILLHISIAWYFSIINLGHPWTADIFPYSVTWFILIVSQLILLHISLLSNPRSVDTSPCFCQSSQSAFSCIQARSRKRILSTKCAHFITYNNYRVAEVARMRGQRLPISVDSDKT